MTRPNGHSDNGNAGAIQEPAGNEALNDVLLPPAPASIPLPEVATRAKQRAKQQIQQNRFVIIGAGAIVVALLIFVATSMPHRGAPQKVKSRATAAADDLALENGNASNDKSLFPVTDSGRPVTKESHEGFINERDGVDIVIGCVDTRKARAAIAKCAEDWSEVDYWLDLGNNADSGQFVLGEPLNRKNRRRALRLRTVSELFPEAIQTELDGDGLPSCSAAEALDRQEPFVNPTLANLALALLARLFRYGTTFSHGGFVSLSSLPSVQALRVDPKHWKRFRISGRLSREPLKPKPVLVKSVASAR